MHSRSKLETGLERTLFASRWLLAPFYLGMVLALVLLLVVFVRELVNEFAHPEHGRRGRHPPGAVSRSIYR
jgi:uncharacterized membrane protein YqhA